MADMHHYTTAISRIVSNDKDEDLILRGHRLTHLIGNASFSEAVFLMIAGKLPTKGQARTLDALWVACVDHGITPPAMIGRAFASYGTTPTAAIAGAILLFGEITGGAGEPLARAMIEALREVGGGRGEPSDASIAQAAQLMVGKAMAAGGRLPGFGIPAHAVDPRTPALLQVARDNGAAGDYCRLLVALEDELARVKGRRIAINLDGVVAALVLDFGLPLECAAAFVMIPRSFSALAHYMEEKSQGTKWRHVPQSDVTYTGPEPDQER